MTSKDTRASWSRGLQDQTLRLLRDPAPLPDGKLHMKHPAEGHGYFILIDLATDRYTLHRDAPLPPIQFDTPEALVAADWVID